MSDSMLETSMVWIPLWASLKDYACKILVFNKAKNRTTMYFSLKIQIKLGFVMQENLS